MVRLASRLLPFLALIVLLAPEAMGQSFVVTNTNDSGAGSLRDTITARNACSACPPITFAIPGCSGSCVISVSSVLPALNNSFGGYMIDGKTQGTAFPGTDVVIDGSALAGGGGLVLDLGAHTIDTLTIRNFSAGAGIRLNGNSDGATIKSSSITGNAIGIVAEAGLSGATVLQNTISGNGGAGIQVLSTATSVLITQNSIVGNGGLGIDLGGDGITPNDAGDADSDPNRLQNFPVITSATWDGTTYTISGTMSSTTFTSIDIEFFGNAAADASGAGEGQIYLGVLNVNTGASGSTPFTFTHTSATPYATITATAIGPDFCGSRVNTSEFSLFPVLSITKTASPSTVTAGQTLNFDISVTNSGAVGASGIQMLDIVPAGFTWDGTWTGADWNCAPSGSDVSCSRTAGDLLIGATTVLGLPMTAPTTPGSYTNSATVTATNTVSKTTATATITLSNSAPVANADTYAATEDTALTVGAATGVLSNDTDVNGQALTASLVTGPSSGTLSLGGDGSFTYTPNANFFGTDTFTYSASDGSASSAAATVTINVAGVPDAPVAANDTATTNEDVSVLIAVLSNDSDPDGTTPSISGNTAAANGTVTCTASNCTYAPNADFNGSDSFTYTITDGSLTATATVSVTVTAVNDAPVATNDTATTSEDTAVVIPVLSNDSDPDGTTPSISGNTSGTSGTVACSATDCTYTPNANFNGTDSFTYTITDGSATATATVTLTVTAGNDSPIAVDDAFTTPEDTFFSTGSIGLVPQGVLLNDTDIDGDTVWVLSSAGPSIGSGSLIDTYGRFGVTPPPDFNGTITYTYTATDGTASSSLATVTITVTPVNDAPVAVDDAASTTVGIPVVIGVLTNDSDVDGDTLSVTSWTNGTLGTVVCTASGSCTYTPGSATGTDSFAYTVSDGAGGTATATVTAVVGADPCPTNLRNLSPGSGDEVFPDGALSWSGGTGADSFSVYLGPRGSGCITLFDSTSTRRANYSGLVPGEYEWRVKAVKSGCEAPPVSACVRFTVIEPCPDTPATLVSPASGANVPPAVTFVWRPVATALRYHVMIATAAGTEEKAVVEQPAGPLPETLSATAEVPAGSVEWWVVAEVAGGCADLTSARVAITACPSAVPQPLAPLQGAQLESSPVEFRWTGVAGAQSYDLYLSVNDGTFELAGSVPGSETDLSLSVEVPAGAALSWYVEAIFDAPCGNTRSETVQVGVACYPPVLSLQGEVTTAKPYQVRATIVSVGLQYLFEESDTEAFTTVLAQKTGEVDPTGEFVFAEFEHDVTEPEAFFYRVRLAQQGCDFSDVGRIVVVPLPPPTSTDTETVVQFGNEEEIRQDLFIPSPTPTLATSYTYIATTDRDWMRVEPAGGTIGQAGVTVTVITNPVGLPVGSNTGTVTLTFVELAGGKSALETTPVTTAKPVSVTLVTPVTNRGKDEPSSESLIIPAVAHASGINSEWQTDLRLLNMGTDKLKYALNLTVSGEDGTLSGKSSEIELAAGQNSALNDVVKQWYGLGSLPGEGATGTLEIRPLGVGGAGKGPQAIPVTRSLVSLASSRTYNKTPQGTLGEYIPAIPFAAFVGGTTPAEGKKSVLSLQQLAQSSAYRTNLGVVEASGQPVGVEIRFYDAEGAKLLSVPLSLQAGEHRQLNQVLAANGLTDVASARAEVEVVSGEGRIAAYASVVDNVTGDPLQVAAVDLAKIGARKYVMPGVAHFNTGLARWRTDVQMFNAGVASVSATLDFYPAGATLPSETATVEIGPGKIRTLSDIVPTLFGQSNTGGAIQISTATNSELVVSGRTYDQRDEGSYGQFMAAVTEDDAIGLGDRAMQVLQMEESRDLRSNLGIVEVSGKEVRVELSAYPAESRVTPRAELTLKPNEFRQLNAVLKSLNAGTTYNARIAVRVIGGEGKIVAYGSAVDNLTQDPTYIPGQ